MTARRISDEYTALEERSDERSPPARRREYRTSTPIPPAGEGEPPRWLLADTPMQERFEAIRRAKMGESLHEQELRKREGANAAPLGDPTFAARKCVCAKIWRLYYRPLAALKRPLDAIGRARAKRAQKGIANRTGKGQVVFDA